MNFAPLGWAVGHSGIIQRTINGGGYWKHHETDTGYNLYGVSFITKRKGWAVGDYGIILRTTGGGFKWEALSSGVTETAPRRPRAIGSGESTPSARPAQSFVQRMVAPHGTANTRIFPITCILLSIPQTTRYG